MNRLSPVQFISAAFAVVCLLAGCHSNDVSKVPSGYNDQQRFAPGDESKIVEAFLTAKDSTSFELQEGTYHFENLSLAQLKHILLKGAGDQKTILDFSSQTQGGEGIRVTGLKGFTIDGMTIRDSKGDLLKITNSEDVIISNLRAIWQKTGDSSNGGYAIYPVLCKNVLVENCYAEGASDAGIYIGQSRGAVVRHSKAYKNVAGCEIENTSNAEVYDNEFYGNTAGFLVFDLPGLSQRGGHVKAYKNYLHDNNEKNFAKAGSFGTSSGVGNASPGSGIIILAASDVEIYENRVINNNTCAIAIASGLATDDKALEKINASYFAFPKNISIRNNTMEMGPAFPAPAYEHHIGKIYVGIEQQLNAQDPSRKNKRLPFILYDGMTTNILTQGKQANPDSVCINQPGANIFVNGDFINIADPKKWRPDTTITNYRCQ